MVQETRANAVRQAMTPHIQARGSRDISELDVRGFNDYNLKNVSFTVVLLQKRRHSGFRYRFRPSSIPNHVSAP
jgi:hypothetical protein